MLLAPSLDDAKAIIRASATGVLAFAAGIALLAPIALVLGEPNAATALLVGAAPAIAFGVLGRRIPISTVRLTWTRGIVTATATWIACAAVAAVPFYLSGHFVDANVAFFDAVSGLTNTGHSLIADLDHLPRSLVLLRSWLEVAGGAAFLLMGQSLLEARRALASSLTPGDAMSEHVMPRTRKGLHRAGKTIGALGATGVVGVGVALVVAGVPIANLPITTISLVAAAATTGGFIPSSGAVGSYHSVLVEFMLVALMLGAATSVGVLAAAARRQHDRIRDDLNFRVYAATLVAVLAGTAVGLARAGTFETVLPIARHGIFSAVAAVTTTGLSTVAPDVFASDFGVLAPAALITGMTVGGMLGSMGGGISTLRTGLLAKGVIGDVRKVLQPEGAVSTVSWKRLGRREILTDAHVRSAATTVMLFLIAIVTGATILLWASGTIGLRGALLTATSAVGNVGLDVGVLEPGQAWYVTLTFTLLMLLGRLQWLGIFAAAGFAVAIFRGHR